MRSRSQASSPPWPTIRKFSLSPGLDELLLDLGPAARCSFRRKGGRRSRGCGPDLQDRACVSRDGRARHRRRAASGSRGGRSCALEQRAQLRVGSEEHLGLASKTRPQSPSPGLQSFWPVGGGWRLGSRRRNQSARRAAYSCTLVCQLAASGRCQADAPGTRPAFPPRWGR